MPPPAKEERGQPPRRRRRVLSLPAVCPCEAIAPAPLLASLLSLAADVAGRGDEVASFPALRRGAGEAVRIAGLLLAFLDAVVANDGDAVLGLSELHVSLQKLRFLLADCGRKGARLWVLMNAELIASELRVVLGSVATAMDVLPRDVVESSEDAGELARLVSEQAWRAVWPDAEDDLAARSVRSVLARFAGGATPDAEDARLALGRVGVATWSGCCEEVAFLESELLDRLEEATTGGGGEDGNDLVLIAGLMAFMVYCRVVLFDRIDDKTKTKKKSDGAVPLVARAPESGVAAWVNEEALRCPITLELMTDPVTVATGQTYDRASIRKWIKSGCRTCPVTGERLRSAELVPNLAVRGIVDHLLLSKGISLHEPNTQQQAPVRSRQDRRAVRRGGGRRPAARYRHRRRRRRRSSRLRKATYEARKLSKRNVFYRACLVDADAVPWLLHLLSSRDPSGAGQRRGGAAQPVQAPGGRRALVEAGGAGLVVDAVNVAAKTEARQNAAAVLFYLSSNPAYCDEVARIPEAVPTLVHLAREGAYRGRKNALVSLYGLLQCAHAHGKAVAAGAVAVLAGLLLSDDNNGDDLAVDAVALLARLAEQPVGARAVLASSALVTRLVDFLGDAAAPSRSAREHCVALLASLGRHGGDKVLALLGKLPGLMPALYALIADGSPQAGKKARWLVNEIHRHYEQRQASAAAASAPAPAPPATAGDRVIIRV
ncbi:hypothetical protein EJB05_49209, partial [Eragrostis curvula]